MSFYKRVYAVTSSCQNVFNIVTCQYMGGAVYNKLYENNQSVQQGHRV